MDNIDNLNLNEKYKAAATLYIIKDYTQASVEYREILYFIDKTTTVHEDDRKFVVQYMLCICLLNSKKLEDLLDAFNQLLALKRIIKDSFPAVHYALAKVYVKFYRFALAEIELKEGFAFLLSNTVFQKYCIPGTEIIINESTKEGLLQALLQLKDKCSNQHEPQAICDMLDCKNITLPGCKPNRNIYFRDPCFKGMVTVTCNSIFSCVLKYHFDCWSYLKSINNVTIEKDIIGLNCFNCAKDKIPNTIIKVEIFGESGQIIAVIKASNKNVIKRNAVSNGAIKKHFVHSIPVINDLKTLYESLDIIEDKKFEASKKKQIENEIGLFPFNNEMDKYFVPEKKDDNGEEANDISDFNGQNNQSITFMINKLREFIETQGTVSVQNVYNKWDEIIRLYPHFPSYPNIDVINLLFNFTDVTITDGMCISKNRIQTDSLESRLESDDATLVENFFQKLVNSDTNWNANAKVLLGHSEKNRSKNSLYNEQNSQDIVKRKSTMDVVNFPYTSENITKEKSDGFDVSDVLHDINYLIPQAASNINNTVNCEKINEYCTAYNEIMPSPKIDNPVNQVSLDRDNFNFSIAEDIFMKKLNMFPSLPSNEKQQNICNTQDSSHVDNTLNIENQETIEKIVKKHNSFLNKKLDNIISEVDKINCSIATKDEEKYKNMEKNILESLSKKLNISIKEFQDMMLNMKQDMIVNDLQQKTCTMFSELETCRKQLDKYTNKLECAEKILLKLKKEIVKMKTENQFEYNAILNMRKEQFKIISELINMINQCGKMMGCGPYTDKTNWETILNELHNVTVNNKESYEMKNLIEMTDIENTDGIFSRLLNISNVNTLTYVQSMLMKFQSDLTEKCQKLSTNALLDSQNSQNLQFAVVTHVPKTQNYFTTIDNTQTFRNFTYLLNEVRVNDKNKNLDLQETIGIVSNNYENSNFLNNNNFTIQFFLDNMSEASTTNSIAVNYNDSNCTTSTCETETTQEELYKTTTDINDIEDINIDCDNDTMNESNNEIITERNDQLAAVDSPSQKAHQLDKLMHLARNKYKGIMELDLLDSLMDVRKSHNNSLSGLSFKKIIGEMDKFVLRRYGKYMSMTKPI